MGQRGELEQLTEVANRLAVTTGRLVRLLRQGHEPGELTLSELSALARVERAASVTPGDLADQERVRPQAMSVIVALLEQQGLVVRDADASDGRRALLSITAAGRALVAGRRSANAGRLAAAVERSLGPREVHDLEAAIALLDRVAAQL